MVRFYQCVHFRFLRRSSLARLYAIDYEIVTYDAVGARVVGKRSLNDIYRRRWRVLGSYRWCGADHAAAKLMSLLSNAWLIYVAFLFVVMVIYAPGGVAGLIMAHLPIWRAGRLAALTVPYLRIVPPVLVGIVGFVGLVELAYSASIGRGQGKVLTLFNHAIDTGSFLPWVVPATLLVCGAAVAASQRPAFVAAWAAVSEETRAKEPDR